MSKKNSLRAEGPVSEHSAELGSALRSACQREIGVLQSSFLCQSISVLEPRMPICVTEDTSVSVVIAHLQRAKVGCVLVTDASGRLSGIFSERDIVLKVLTDFSVASQRPVADFMTKDPTAELPDTTVAFALNLMSLGGFRHLPIVDGDRMPLGIISVKDVVDFIVKSFMADIEAIPLG